MKILRKISLVGVLAVLSGAMMLSFFGFYYVRGLLEQGVGDKQDLLVQQSIDRIDEFLYRRTLDIQYVARNISMSQVLRNEDVSELNLAARIDAAEKFTGPWEVLSWIDLNGNIIYSSFGSEIGEKIEKYIDEGRGYESAIAGNIYTSDVVISRITGGPTLIFAVPVRDINAPGQPIIGVCIGNLIWPAVIEALEVFKTESAYLYNENGEYIGGNVAKDRKFILNPEYNLIKKEYFLEIDAPAVILPNIKTGEPSLVSHKHESGYLDYRGKGWFLLVETPTSVALEGVASVAIGVLWITILMILIVSFLAFYFLRLVLIKPLIDLTKVTKEITSGDLTKRVAVSSKDEIGDLGISFNQMADGLLEAKRGLERKVEQRTKELDGKVTELEESQKAVVNILEDVQHERDHAKEERDKIDTILKSIGDAVFVVDPKLNIILANEITANLSGYMVSEMVGQNYQKVLRFVYENSVKNEINDKFVKDAIATGKTQEMTNHTVLIHKDGTRLPVADSSAPLKNVKGEIIGCVVVFRDVTKERAIDKAKTEFVSLASHQLRTPLSAINWYSEMLLEGDAGKLTAEQSRYMREIARGNKRMIDLVGALLNVSRLELGTFSIEPGSIKITEVAENELKALEPKIKEKKLKITKKYSENIPKKYLADAKLLAIVIGNLLSNAVKYTPDKGKVDLSISKEKTGIVITVKDTGYGIPRLQQKRIFEKLFRADNVRAMDTDGTGLGLYIVKMILDQIGGRVWFETVESKGSKFYVEMPLKGWQKKEGTKKLD